MTITLAIPSKGRLKDQSLETLARAGLAVSLPGDDRKYRARIEGRADIEIAFLSASEIAGEIGQGSVVSVYLPRHVGATESAESPGADPELPRAEVGESVLVVDDEPTIRMLICNNHWHLQSHG